MSSLPEEGVIAGKYRLERLLAQGGMGSVWVAKHLQLGIPVAIKLMSSDYATSAEARERLEVMVETTDGFKIAEADLKIRGPGEMAGTAQSGNRDFKIADLVQDGKLLEVARQAAMRIVEGDPKLAKPENKGMLGKVQERRSQTAVITVS